MPEQILKTLDSYSLRARLMPALLTILPATLGIAAWFPDKLALLGSLLGFIAVFGAVSFLSECVRDLGKKLEKLLIREWDGLPSTVLLRHRSNHLNPETKARYHSKLSNLLPDVTIPAADEEEADEEGADQCYATCGDFLREQTRDPGKYALLLSENIQYGTRRNLLGVKPIALWIAIPSLLCSATALIFAIRQETPFEVALVCSVIILLCLIFWLCRVNSDWVKTTAFSYAERLLATTETIK